MIWTVNFELEEWNGDIKRQTKCHKIFRIVYRDSDDHKTRIQHEEHIWSNWKRLHRRDFFAIYLLLRQVPRQNGIEMKMEFRSSLCRASRTWPRHKVRPIHCISRRLPRVTFLFFRLRMTSPELQFVSCLANWKSYSLLLHQQLDIYIKSYTFLSVIYGMPVSVYFPINYFAVLLQT